MVIPIKMAIRSSLLFILLLAAGTANEISTSSDAFGNSIYSLLPTSGKNAIFSPLSIHSVLALAYEASAGQTFNNLKSVLALPTKPVTAVQYKSIMTEISRKTSVAIDIANKVYVRNNLRLNTNFERAAREFFLAETGTVDFRRTQQAADEINGWVRQKTAGHISGLVTADDFDRYTRAVLLNAIYFKGKWAAKFNPEETRPEKFYVNQRETIYCSMMHQMGDYYFTENEDLDAKMVKLNFNDERFGLVIILPNSKTGIDDLEKRLARVNLTELNNQYYGRQVDVYLPRFKIESSFDLEPPLNQAGLQHIFSDNAEFPGMIDNTEDLKISKIIQKATIEINEEGGEASAASLGIIAVPISADYVPPPREIFNVDHPFMFLVTFDLQEDIYNRGDVVVFMGKVTIPEIANYAQHK